MNEENYQCFFGEYLQTSENGCSESRIRMGKVDKILSLPSGIL